MAVIALRSALVVGLIASAALAVGGCGGTRSDTELVASARAHLGKRDPQSAIVQLKSALASNPQSPAARYLLGVALLDAEQPAAAIVELERALELKHGDDEVVPKLARALLAVGQVDKAVERFVAVDLSDSKAAAELKATMGAAMAAQGRIDRAAANVDAALKLDANNLQARLLKIRLTAGKGAYDEALTQVRSLLADHPKSHEAKQLEGELLWARDGKVDSAIPALRAALAMEPRSLSSHSALIAALVQKGDLGELRSQLEVAKKAVPGSAEVRFFEVQLALLSRDGKAARESIQQLLRIAPESPAALQLAGAVELHHGSLVRAESFLTKALQKAPHLGQARRLLAETNLRAGRPARALAGLQPLLEAERPQAEELALAAQAYLLAGNPAAAESLFARAAKANPDDAKLRAAVSVAKVLKGDAAAGLAELESQASSDKSTHGDMALISARLRRGENDAALEAITRLEKKTPGSAIAPQLRGQILAQRKDFAGARQSFEKALVADPAYFPAIKSLAGLDILEKKHDAAKARYQAVLAREPNNADALLALANIARDAGAKAEEVGALLSRAIQANPTEEVPRLQLIDLQLANRQFKVARDAAQEAVAALPDSFNLLDALGRTQLALGDTQQAADTFRRLSAMQPASPVPHLRLADTYTATKDNSAVEQSLRRALEVSPKLLTAQRGLVRIAVAEKRFGEAMKIAQAVQREQSGNGIGWLLEADVHIGQGKLEPAVVALRAAFERSKTSEVAKRLHAAYVLSKRWPDAERLAAQWLAESPRDLDFLVYIGAIAVDRKEYAKAEGIFRQVLAQRKDDPMAHNNLAWAMLMQGKPGALSHAERANEILPDRAEVMETLALALSAASQHAKALEWQRKVVAKAPDTPSYRFQLAKLLLKNGAKDEARAELEKLAYLGDKFADQLEVAKLLGSL